MRIRNVFRIIPLLFILCGFVFTSCDKVPGKTNRSGYLVLDMVHHNPGESLTQTSFTNPEKLAEYGYTGKVLNDFKFAHCAITYDEIDKRIFPEGSASRAWVDSTANYIQNQIEQAHQSNIELFCFIDIIVIPKKLKELYKDSLCNEEGVIDIHKPFTQKVHRVMVKEIFERFPDLDGLVVRTGETYLQNVPFHTGNSPITRDEESHIALINLLKDEVCEKYGKKLIYRTWDFGFFHTNPEYYLNVTNNVNPHEKLYFAIKHTDGDYHRTFKFNPTLTLGKHKQIVEVQCQREYEGKGAHPDYVMNGVINGFEEYKNDAPPKSLKDIVNHPNFAGIWSWSRGGGWTGPYIQNELWCDLNAYVISKYGQNPTRSEEEIFYEYCDRMELSTEDAHKFRELNLLSAKGVGRGHSSLIADVNVWWTRDMFFGGLEELKESFTKIIEDKKVKDVLDEKSECVQTWEKINQLAGDISSGSEDFKKYLIVSSKYGLIKYSIIEQAWIILLKGLEGEYNGSYDLEQMKHALLEYDKLWVDFKLLKAENDNCATLYIPYSFVYRAPGFHNTGGMQESVDKYRMIIFKDEHAANISN